MFFWNRFSLLLSFAPTGQNATIHFCTAAEGAQVGKRRGSDFFKVLSWEVGLLRGGPTEGGGWGGVSVSLNRKVGFIKILLFTAFK